MAQDVVFFRILKVKKNMYSAALGGVFLYKFQLKQIGVL